MAKKKKGFSKTEKTRDKVFDKEVDAVMKAYMNGIKTEERKEFEICFIMAWHYNYVTDYLYN